MKNEKEKELDINEVAITLEVDAEVIEKVRSCSRRFPRSNGQRAIRASCCPTVCGSRCQSCGHNPLLRSPLGALHERIKCAVKKVRGGVKKESEMFWYVADFHYLCSEK